MPTLPSGRRIEFSLDRFHALMARGGSCLGQELAARLVEPDDLLHVLDAVHFSRAEGQPYFAGYVASDWATYAADWSTADRQFLQDWLFSPAAREVRAEAIDYIRDRLLGQFCGRVPYPYQVQDGLVADQATPRLRQ